MGSALGALNLIAAGVYGSRDEQFLSRWSKAGVDARRSLPSCTGATISGRRCGMPRLRGHECCRLHLRDPRLRTDADAEREARARAIVEKGNPPCDVKRAMQTLRAIAKRRLHQAWKTSPTIEGATIRFATDADRDRAVRWLKEQCNVDLDGVQPSGQKLTCRAVDRCLWAAHRVVRADAVSDEFQLNAKRRVVSALADDEKYWKRWAKSGGEDQGL